MDDTPTLIKAKDLKKTDRWKYSLSDRSYNIVTELYDLDPDQSQTSPHFKNKLLVLEGCKQFCLDKEAEVFRIEHIPFDEFIRKHIEFKHL